jgi:ATP-dependent Clp protease ATP-binding subunit ClpA
MNGYNFTERVRTTLSLARDEAARLHHPYVGTEHILLGIVHEGEGVAMTVLQNLGVSPENLENSVKSKISVGRAIVDDADLPYNAGAKKVLELAMSQARDLGHTYVGTEHALLGLIAEGGLAAVALKDAGVSLVTARAETLRILGETDLEVRPSAYRADSVTSSRLAELLSAARKVAAERRATEVSPVHLTIAVLEHDGGMANAVLDRLDLDRVAALTALDELAPLGPQPTAPSALNPQTLRAIDEASQNSKVARSDYILLGLIRTSEDIAGVFEAQGISADDVFDEIRHISG